MAVKLDMSKTFDRVEWGFISKVMEKLGFCNRWRDLVMQCITLVSYSVLINGVAYGNIHPSRGLHQGDPLFPSLFLLCAKGLSALIHQAARNKLITGISITKGCPKVTHLLFVDDSILFCKASLEECHMLRSILMEYEEASGQKVNTDKSSIFFSPNTAQATKDEIFNILGPMQNLSHTKYLGLPLLLAGQKSKSLQS